MHLGIFVARPIVGECGNARQLDLVQSSRLRRRNIGADGSSVEMIGVV